MQNVSAGRGPIKIMPNGECLVSVLVPLFNHEQYVLQCLDSIGAQAHRDIELLILDDGSTDNSFQLAQQWVKTNATHFSRCQISRQANRGIPVTFNRLVHASSGKYVFLVASDDIVAPGAITNLVLFYRSHCTDYTLLITDVSLMDQQGKVFAQSAAIWKGRNLNRLEASAEFLKRQVILKWDVPFFHQFYSRAFYDSIGGYDESLDFEDMYFALCAAANDQLRFTRIVSKWYRMRDGRTQTPGIPTGFHRDVDARCAVLDKFSFGWQCILRILNARDSSTHGLPRIAIKAIIVVIRLVAKLLP